MRCLWCWFADVTRVLCELELIIRRVKVSTTPDGKVMDLFFITDTRFISSFVFNFNCVDHFSSFLI